MFSLHNHSGISSASRGFSDSSIKLEDLVKEAKALGLNGVAITDHESVGAFIQAKNLEEKLDFPVILGNEIYLVSEEQDNLLRNEYETGMYYPHFLLLALDEVGNEQLREMSSIAWENSYTQRGMTRTSTLMSDVEKIVGSNKGHVVASSACLGSQLSQWIMDIMAHEDDIARVEVREQQIHEFIRWNEDTFGKGNFFLEAQPPSYLDESQEAKQAYVNNYMLKLNKELGTPVIITTDSHYLSKDLLDIHRAFLNSKDGGDEREVDAFYGTAYLMSKEEIVEYFEKYWDMEDIQMAIDNTNKIGARAERYSLKMKQIIPKIDLEEGWEFDEGFFPSNYEYINKMTTSKYEQDRYLLYLIQEGMKDLLELEDYEKTFERVEQEVTEFWYVSDIIEDRLGAYFVTIAKLVEIMWDEGDSLVGVGRGSAVSSIISYLLGVTQINPLKMPVEMPFYRFIDRERAEMADIDIDTQSNRRTQVFLAVQKYFDSLGGEVVNCCTYGTLGAKSAIQTAARGLGIAPEDARAISSLVPTERGFAWSLSDCYYGDKETGKKPIREFVNLINAQERLWDTAKLIEGVIVNRGTHASGVFITNDKFEKYGSKMRSPDGTITSQWDLHDSEQHGLIKYDFLTISALTKIRLTLESLVENDYIEEKETLKDTYYSVLDPHTMDYDKPEIWDLVQNNKVPDLFQFDSLVAMQTVAQIKPRALVELAQTNSLLRLQPQEGAKETPAELYARYRKNIKEWYVDMDKANVPKEDQKILEKTLLTFNGVADTQEAIMLLSRDKELTGFTVGEAHELRSVIGKKKMELIPGIRKKFFDKGLANGVCQNTLDYIWNSQVLLQLGYSFSILHTMAYTAIALQELVLFNNYPSIYWNTATLTVNSGSVEEGIEDEELQSKSRATDYGKVAASIGDLQQRGVTVALPLMNQANYSFTPDEENNRIIFGLRGILGIGDDVANTILNLRPFKSFEDFYDRVTYLEEDDEENVKIQNSKIITLIKAGGFDEIESGTRQEVMMKYLQLANEPKTTLNMQNWRAISQYGILPERFYDLGRIVNFKNHVLRKESFVRHDEQFVSKDIYVLRESQEDWQQITNDFFEKHFMPVMEEGKHYWYDDSGFIEVYDSDMQKFSNELTTELRNWLKTDEAIDLYNDKMYDELWNKSCQGSLSKWEMDSVCFYSHDHELAHLRKELYNIADFHTLPKNARVVKTFKWRGMLMSEYEIHRIVGTVLDRDNTKHTVSLLTPTGVVTLKMYAGNFAHYDKQITETEVVKGKEKNTIVETSWFTRGNLLSVVGFKRGSTFIPKKYRNSVYQHTIQKITDVTDEGYMTVQTDRRRVD